MDIPRVLKPVLENRSVGLSLELNKYKLTIHASAFCSFENKNVNLYIFVDWQRYDKI